MKQHICRAPRASAERLTISVVTSYASCVCEKCSEASAYSQSSQSSGNGLQEQEGGQTRQLRLSCLPPSKPPRADDSPEANQRIVARASTWKESRTITRPCENEHNQLSLPSLAVHQSSTHQAPSPSNARSCYYPSAVPSSHTDNPTAPQASSTTPRALAPAANYDPTDLPR